MVRILSRWWGGEVRVAWLWAWLRPGWTQVFVCLRRCSRGTITDWRSVRACKTRGDGGEPDGWHFGTAQVMHRHPVLDLASLREYLGRGHAMSLRRCAA